MSFGCATHPTLSFSGFINIRCATHRWMRHASRGVLTAGNCNVESYCNRDWMRHASTDAPRIQKKSKAQISLHDKDCLNAPRIHGCVTHPNLRVPDYKTDRGQFFCRSLPHFSIRTRFSDLVQRSENLFFHF